MKLYQITVRAIALVLALFAFTANSATAQVVGPVVPSGTAFGSQPGFTFGGSGISYDWVMSNNSLSGVLFGLTATPRYSNPAVTNDGAGTFFAQAGVDAGSPSLTDPYAMWNVSFAITGANASQYSWRMFYDFDPAVGNFGNNLVAGGYGFINLSPIPYQDSWNFGMDFMSLPSVFPGSIFPPLGSFDPNAAGQYGIQLAAYDAGFNKVAYASILVDTRGAQEVVPEPATMTLLATGLAGMAATRRKKKNAAQV